MKTEMLVSGPGITVVTDRSMTRMEKKFGGKRNRADVFDQANARNSRSP
jgi:hypothetical protein